MTRPLPAIRQPELSAMAVFTPEGAAYLQVGAPGVGEAIYTVDQVDQLEDIIASFKRAVLFEDGRPEPRRTKHREALR